MYNKSNKVYTVHTVIGIRSTLYTGVTKSVVKKDKMDIRVGPKTGNFHNVSKHFKIQLLFNFFLLLIQM